MKAEEKLEDFGRYKGFVDELMDKFKQFI